MNVFYNLALREDFLEEDLRLWERLDLERLLEALRRCLRVILEVTLSRLISSLTRRVERRGLLRLDLRLEPVFLLAGIITNN